MLRLAKLAALVSVVVLLNAVTTLLFVQTRGPAGAAGPAPCVDGDVNGDSSLNIADPIYLLTHFFQGGPGPVACAQTSPADIADAVDAALARYLPRAGERVYFEAVVPQQSTQLVLTVPAGKVFVLHCTNGQVNIPGAQLLNGMDSSRWIDLLPGTDLILINNYSQTFTMGIWGHWLDLP